MKRAANRLQASLLHVATAGLVALALGGLTPALPSVAVLDSFKDDAFYYLQIARNLARGLGFTFDGIHVTNGFHPLWLFCLLPGARVLPGDMPAVRLAALLQLLFVALACVDIVKILRPRVGYWPTLAGVMILASLPGTQFVFFSGMETALLLLLLIRIWRCWLIQTSRSEQPILGWAVLGVWCSLAFLTRLEAGFVVLLVTAFSYRYWQNRKTILLALATPTAITLAGYLCWNRVAFSTWVPISGMVKWSHAFTGRFDTPVSLPRRLLESFLPLVRLIAAVGLSPKSSFWLYCVCLGLLVIVAVKYRLALFRRIRASAIELPLAMCFGLWLIENLSLPYAAPWYPIAPFLATAVLVAAITAETPQLAQALAILLVATGLGRSALHTWSVTRHHDSYTSRTIEAANWAQSHIPPTERIGSWNAGMFGYLAHRPVVNLDGLVNDVEYYRRVLLQRRFGEYVAEEQIRWFADGVFTVASLSRPTYGPAPWQMTVPVQLAYRACEPQGAICSGFAIWRVVTPVSGP